MGHAISLSHRRTARVTARLRADSRLQQAAWFGGVSAIAFIVPLVFSSWLELHHDVYCLVYYATSRSGSRILRSCE